MAARFTTASEPRVLGSPGSAHADAIEARGRELIASVLRPGDVSKGARFVLENLAGAILQLKSDSALDAKKIAKLEAVLLDLASIVEQVPILARRVAALEQVR